MGATNWKLIGQYSDNQVEELKSRYNLPRGIAIYFASRNIAPDSVPNFLEPKLGQLSDPYRFPGIREAAKRLWTAIQEKEPILVHGDYDTDGITASALLAGVLRQNGGTVHSFIPHRFDDGYGFTPESLRKAIQTFGKCRVLVTVDCGITSCDAVDEALAEGIDVIVTDHHEAGATVPKALAVVNPKLYPELSDLELLSGAGSAFKLAHAFVKYGRENNLGGFQTRLEEFLDFVALGTVADIVPLLGENRLLVNSGIEILRRQQRPGIRALIEGSRLHADLTPSDITFKLAPRINAAGRVGDANVALQLLESENIVDAYECAAQLETYNRMRQEKEQEIYRDACEQISRNLAWQSRCVLLVAGRDWHQGVIGIVASRLARDYNRPTIVLTVNGDEAYGSGRSIAGLNLVEMLSRTSSLLERYGGHPMAVGIGLKAEKIAPFFEALDREISKVVAPESLEHFLAYDGELEPGELTTEFYRYLGMLGPFGHSNPKPVFRFNDVEAVKLHALNGNHCRGTLSKRGHLLDFIAFNRSVNTFRGRSFDVLAVPQLNTRFSTPVSQLNIIDVRSNY